MQYWFKGDDPPVSVVNLYFSPPVRWGLLDFMYAVFPSFLLSFLPPPPLPPYRQMLRGTSKVQWAMPDLNRELQSGLGNAGSQPGSSTADWATPDLNRGAPQRTRQRRTSTGELRSGLGNAGPHPGAFRAEWAAPDLSCQKICQKMCQKYVRKECQKECQKICQKKCQKICQKICPKICQKICQKI